MAPSAKRPRLPTSLSLHAAVASLTAACGAPHLPPAMQGKKEMLSATAIAEKCDQAAKVHDRPFVVQWDATDLASFEAKAARDAILVHYDGCKLDVLYECSDPSYGGAFGTYGTPHFTSGTVQGFDVKNQSELYAELPLGAARLSGRLEAGETLHLKYFVSGVSTSTRDTLYRGDVDRLPACSKATHFVWGYNIGAFELDTSSSSTASASAGFAGIGAGGAQKRDEASLAHGGNIAACTTQDQRACRVPIRLALRAITAGANPAGTIPMVPMMVAGGAMPPGMPPVPAGSPVAQWEATPAGQAHLAYMDGLKKLEAGDGNGCLERLDRAVALDPSQFDNHQFRYTHARCLMRAGKCDDGTRDLRATMAAEDTKRIKSDETLDKEVRAVANRDCGSSSAKRDADFVERASHELHDAATANDGALCRAKYDAIYARIDKLDRKSPDDGAARGRGIMALEEGARCVAKAKGCGVGLELWTKKYRLQLPNMTGVDKIAKESWGTLIKLKHVECR